VQRRARVASAFLLLLFGCVEAHGQGHLTRRLLTVQVEINGVTGTFLIDTGANCTVVDSTLAQHLGLKPSGVASLERNYSTEQAVAVIADSVRLGPKLWSDVPIVVLDLSTLSRTLARPISGVLGTDLLATVMLKLSYSSGTAQVITDVGRGGTFVTLSRVRNRYLVPVAIGSSTFEMLLDSGTNMTALSDPAWRTLTAWWKPHDLVQGIQSSGSPPGSLIACIPAFRVGGVTPGEIVLNDHPLRVIMPSQSGSFADTAFAGILGGDILERFEVVLDLQRAAMYLKPDARFRPDPFEFITVGIQFFKANDEFSVAAVWKDSPAEAAGVIVGDRILSVNGHSSSGLDVETFANQLHGTAGTPVVMEINRAGARFTLEMKTRQLVCQSPQ
jgi:hypothetical protein